MRAIRNEEYRTCSLGTETAGTCAPAVSSSAALISRLHLFRALFAAFIAAQILLHRHGRGALLVRAAHRFTGVAARLSAAEVAIGRVVAAGRLDFLASAGRFLSADAADARH